MKFKIFLSIFFLNYLGEVYLNSLHFKKYKYFILYMSVINNSGKTWENEFNLPPL